MLQIRAINHLRSKLKQSAASNLTSSLFSLSGWQTAPLLSRVTWQDLLRYTCHNVVHNLPFMCGCVCVLDPVKQLLSLLYFTWASIGTFWHVTACLTCIHFFLNLVAAIFETFIIFWSLLILWLLGHNTVEQYLHS